MEERKRGNCNGFESLAPEIISEILARLPIEWIMTCKSVCKTWCALINDNYFVKLQLSIANGKPSSRVIFEPWENRFQYGFGKLYMLDVADCKVRTIPGFPLAEVTNNWENQRSFMCSLDGLICVSGTLDPVVIYNPLLRGDYIILPKTDIRNVYDHSHHITLGFDPSINKYKAVRMLGYYGDSSHLSLCEVITIGEESSWRRVVAPYAGLFRHLYGSRGGAFHQGSIYWIIDKFNVYNGETSNSNNRVYILEFDVTKEVFGVVSFPRSMRAPKYRKYNDRHRFNMQLQILGGSLALMEKEGRLLHIWRLLKQNGVTAVVGYSSITIEPSYKYSTIIDLLCPNGTEDFLLLRTEGDHYEPGRRFRSKNGEMIKIRGTNFSHYYPYSKKNDRFVYLLSSLQIPSAHFCTWCFKPSLISIKAALLSHL